MKFLPESNVIVGDQFLTTEMTEKKGLYWPGAWLLVLATYQLRYLLCDPNITTLAWL